MGSYLQQYSSKQQLVVCIHTADLEFLVHTKTSSMSTAASMSYSIALTSYDCLQNLHMQDSYVKCIAILISGQPHYYSLCSEATNCSQSWSNQKELCSQGYSKLSYEC